VAAVDDAILVLIFLALSAVCAVSVLGAYYLHRRGHSEQQ
jgi:hypothetical protein